MKFSFGIITDGSDGQRISRLLSSIEADVPADQCEIIVVGGNIHPHPYSDHKYTICEFDESVKPAWITRKKNIITQVAKYDNIVYMHDYVALANGWYKGFTSFGDDFDVCMTRIVNPDGSRYRDWVTWWDYAYAHVSLPHAPGMVLPPYHYHNTAKMYISGAYWIAKKEYMLKYPLDEEKSWGQGEDVEWSLQRRDTWNYKMNTNSIAVLLKYKDKVFPEVNFVP